jgi:hypothetical protein
MAQIQDLSAVNMAAAMVGGLLLLVAIDYARMLLLRRKMVSQPQLLRTPTKPLPATRPNAIPNRRKHLYAH